MNLLYRSSMTIHLNFTGPWLSGRQECHCVDLSTCFSYCTNLTECYWTHTAFINYGIFSADDHFCEIFSIIFLLFVITQHLFKHSYSHVLYSQALKYISRPQKTIHEFVTRLQYYGKLGRVISYSATNSGTCL